MFQRRLLSALMVVGMLALPASGQDKSNLTWKFEKDKTFFQKMETTTKQTMKVQTNDVVQTQTQTFWFSWKVLDKKDDLVTLEQTIEGVKMDIDIGNQKISYDSTAKENANNPLGEFFKALVGSKFTLTLNTKTMKVTEIKGRAEFLDKLVKANPQMKPLLDQILSEKALMEMAEPTFAAVPGKEVAKGDKWERNTVLDMGPIGKYENNYKYTFEGKDEKEKKLDKIKVETTLKYKEPAEVAGAGTSGLPFKIKNADLKSTSATGTILFDATAGRIEKSNMTVELSGKLTIEIGGQSTEVNLTQTQKSDVETGEKSLLPAPK
jgi:Family of unknown function (DUF6263)